MGMSLSRNIYLARNRRLPTTRAQSELWDYVADKEVEFNKNIAQHPA
jgi:hypothetical protein